MRISNLADHFVAAAFVCVLGCQSGTPGRETRKEVDAVACVAHYRSIASPVLTMHQFAADPKLVELLQDIGATRETVKKLVADKNVGARNIGVMIAAASGDPSLYPVISRLYLDAKTDAEIGRIDVMGEYTLFTASMRLDSDRALNDLILLQARSRVRGNSFPPRAMDFLKRRYLPCLLLTYIPAGGEHKVVVAKVPGYFSNVIGDRAATLVESGRLSTEKARELWFSFGDDRVAEAAVRRIVGAIAVWRHSPDFSHGPVNEIAKVAGYYRLRCDFGGVPYLILALELAKKTDKRVSQGLLVSALLAATRGEGPDDAADWRRWYEETWNTGGIKRAEAEVEKALEKMRAKE